MLKRDTDVERSVLLRPIELKPAETREVAGGSPPSRSRRLAGPCPGLRPGNGSSKRRSRAMSNRNSNEDPNVLPKPIALTPEQVRQIAAGTAAALPISVLPPSWRGNLPAPVLEAGLQELIA
jgi:hypothetical protein